MAEKLITLERLKQLHEAARYAKSHGGGQVTLQADELLEVLPPEPKEEKSEHAGTGTAADRETPRVLTPAEPAVPVAVEGTGSDPAKPAEEKKEAPAAEEAKTTVQ